MEKRKAELRISLDHGVVTLQVLQRLESMVASSAFMAYALWNAGPGTSANPASGFRPSSGMA